MPMIGEIRAAGLTAEELENEVADRLKRKGLIEQPEVLVTVTDYQAKPIYVIGEVDNPGQYVHVAALDPHRGDPGCRRP